MKIIIKNFQKKIPINPKRIKNTILKVLSIEAEKILGEITVCFVNDKKIKEFNLKYLNKNSPTDVLAFDMLKQDNSGRRFFDIIVSVDMAIRNARLFRTKPLYEVNLYVIHGLLHLLGYDDRTPEQRRLMRQKEREYVYTQNRGNSLK